MTLWLGTFAVPFVDEAILDLHRAVPSICLWYINNAGFNVRTFPLNILLGINQKPT